MTPSRNRQLKAFDYPGRKLRLEESLAEQKLDALLVTHLPNIRYLCGFTGTAGVLLVACGRWMFFTDGRYREQARNEVRGAKVVLLQGPALNGVAKTVGKLKLHALGLEGEHITLSQRDRLARLLARPARLRSTHGIVEELRAVKEPGEIAQIRRAVLLASNLFEPLLKHLKTGVSELELSAELEYAARKAGAEGMSFETIVAAGKRSAFPHGRASRQPVPGSGFVVLDFGVILGGYCSDMTRTVHVGKLRARERNMYEAVREAQQAAIEAVAPGVEADKVDSVARSVLRRKNYSKYFTHSIGHGVGLEIHEAPRLAKGQRQGLRPGMVITIEPGIYIPGEGGVRIEDMLIVTEFGYEVLTPTPKDLIAL